MADDRKLLRRPSPIRLCASWLRVPAILLGLSLLCDPLVAQNNKAEKSEKAESSADLPPGYQPPLDKPELMLIEKNLLTPDERKDFKRDLRKYQTRLRNGDLRDSTAEQEVRNGIRYRLNELTYPANLKDLTKLRRSLTGSGGDLQQAGRLLQKQDQVVDFRRKVMQLVADETSKLFDNNYYVRVQAALLLGELNVIDEDSAKEIKAVPFSGSAKALCKVLNDPDQPEGVKIVCMLSLIRMLHYGEPNVDQKREIATAIVSELKRADAHPWYQFRLAEALGYVDVSLDLDRNPFVYDALLAIVRDKKRDLRTRVQAAWSLGRHPLERSANVQQLTTEIAALAHELAVAQAANPKNAEWKRCALVLYLAFEKKDEKDLDAKRDRKGGLLNNPLTKAEAEAAFQQILPIVRDIIAQKTVSPEQIQDLGKWLQTRLPPVDNPPHGGKPANDG